MLGINIYAISKANRKILEGENMTGIITITQLFFTLIIGMYFFTRLKSEKSDTRIIDENAKKSKAHLDEMRRIRLREPLTEAVRPSKMSEIVGQEDGIRAITAALCGPHPQHIIIYGPAGVGKTAAARLALEEAKKSAGTPFLPDAKFIEADATIMRCDERSIADPLIGSVHDPIYQGAGAYGTAGIPQPKMGAVTKAHGGVLFIDEIGELPCGQMNKLLKVLEDRRVLFESAYYNEFDKTIPEYIHDIFRNGMPADFRLIGATTKGGDDIPEAIRSRCIEIFFNPLTRDSIEKIVVSASKRLNMELETGALSLISQYAKNGRDAVKILQMAKNNAFLDKRRTVTVRDALFTLDACRYTNGRFLTGDERIVDISVIKP